MRAQCCLLSLLLLHSPLLLAESPAAGETQEITGSVASLLPEQAEDLSKVLPGDRQVRWKLYVPRNDSPSGVLVFVSPGTSGDLQPGWARILEQRNLIWIAAEDYGNPAPVSQRILVALMGLTFVQRNHTVDTKRIYIGGMSGGGRVASAVITKFPRLFTGAVYIVGANFWTPEEAGSIKDIAANRYVFLTGENDFNRQDTRNVLRKYRNAGVEQTLLIDLPRFGHEYPNAHQLARALEFLDTGVTPGEASR